MLDFYSKKNRKRKILLFFMLSLTAPYLILAQDSNDSIPLNTVGTISDNYGNPLANVVVRSAQNDTLANTDENGFFQLNGEKNLELLFDHRGFYVKRMKINPRLTDKDTLEIRLTERYLKNPDTLDVLYATVDKHKYLGSASTVYTNEIANTLSPTFFYSLPGKLTGLYTEQFRGIRAPATSSNSNPDLIGSIPVLGNSAPSDNTEFYINLRGQSPVTVIDGVQRDISSIDPENIESISVQKDALSSILLGMRSSRGVLLVTTKKPDQVGFEASFTAQSGIQESLKMPEPLSAFQYAYMLNEALQNNGTSPVYTAEDFDAFKNGTDPYLHPNVNWYDKALKETAPISSYNLNVKGGGETARYFVGLGYFNQQGLFESSDENNYDTNFDLKRYLITSKLDVDVTEDFELQLSLFGRIEDGLQPGAGAGNILSSIYSTPNNAYPVFNPNDSYGGNVSFTNNILSQTVNSGYIKDSKKDAIATIDLNYDLHNFVKGLSVKALSSISTQNRSATVRNKQGLVYQYQPTQDEGGVDSYTPFGSLNSQSNNFVSVATSRYWYGQLALNYETSFGKHFLEGKLLGDQYVISLNYDLPQRPADLAANVKYNYAGKYFAEVAVNHAYYNRYRPGKQWGTFYAFGAGWDIAREDFLNQVTWLDQLKLRTVYGKTGSGIDNSGYYIWRQSYFESPVSHTYLQGYSDALGNGVYENSPLANPNITWEKANKLNIGVDISMFDSHLNITADYYYDKYYDLLQIRGKSIALIGFAYPPENIGKNLFKGIETSLTYQNNISDFNYFVTANWSQNSSEVLYTDEQFKPQEYNKRTGQPVGARFGLVADGFYSTPEEIAQSAVIEGFEIEPGDIRYKDLNNDGVVDQFDQKPIGNTKPLSFYGLTAGFNFKGFDFSILVQGVYNRDIYVADNILQAGFQGIGQSYGQAYKPIINRWTPETAETATYPRLSAGGSSYNLSPNGWSTSFWVKSGDYVRIKNLNLGYTLPLKWTKGFLESQIKIFANASNLFTHASYDLVDPEVSNFTNYPLQRVISGGLNLKF